MIFKSYGWQDRLHKTITERRGVLFQWGENDCTSFVADCILAMTGTDIIEKARGAYSTDLGAFKSLLKYYECDNLKQLFLSYFEEKHIAFARPGDVVFQNSNYLGFNIAVGICNGAHSFGVAESEYLEQFDTLALDGCFHVPNAPLRLF